MGRYLSSSAVERHPAGDLEVARVAITLRSTTSPGYLFTALENGGVAAFLTGENRPEVN
jgi:hypothetical protein